MIFMVDEEHLWFDIYDEDDDWHFGADDLIKFWLTGGKYISRTYFNENIANCLLYCLRLSVISVLRSV